jgi:predicted porin
MGQGTAMKKLKLSVALTAAAFFASADFVYAADKDATVTKAPVYKAPAQAAPAACGSIYDFFLTSCPLSWYGVTFYGTVDVGGGYQTNGTRFDPNSATGGSEFLNAKSAQGGKWSLFPNGLSQSNVGFKVQEAIGGGWSFIGDASLAFDPYSLRLANNPLSLQNAIGVPLPQQATAIDSSRWGWLASQIYAGVSNPTYGTLTFGRQNALTNDAIVAYDPMGASYAFSPIGFQGTTCGVGDTEECRWTTAIKYRENIGPVRIAVMGQPLQYGAYNPNNGAIAGQLGGDIKGIIPGVLSLDVIGSWVKDAVNISPSNSPGGGLPAQAINANGMPVAPFLANTFLQAVVSNNVSVMALAKWTINLLPQAPAPLVTKGAPLPPPATGGQLTLYAGFEGIQYTNPSDPQTVFRDDGYNFSNVGGNAAGNIPTLNGTTIANNAFNATCGSGGGCTAKLFYVWWGGAKYGITKDLDIIGAYYHYQQDQYVITAAGCANSGSNSRCAGTMDAFSAVLDWRFLPKWDVYIGTMFSQYNGGLDNGYLVRNNLSTDAGVRFRF